jgi:carbon-monoxide dehydrogenase medium subunit
MALKEGASWLGSPQIRNIGTLSGNIVSGQPGADTTIPLLALNAQVKVVNKKGERIIPLAEFFIDTGKTAVDSSRDPDRGFLSCTVKDKHLLRLAGERRWHCPS